MSLYGVEHTTVHDSVIPAKSQGTCKMLEDEGTYRNLAGQAKMATACEYRLQSRYREVQLQSTK